MSFNKSILSTLTVTFLAIALLPIGCGGDSELGGQTSNATQLNPLQEGGGSFAIPSEVTRTVDLPYTFCSHNFEVEFIRPVSNTLQLHFDILNHLITVTSNATAETDAFTIDHTITIVRKIKVSEIANPEHFVTQEHQVAYPNHMDGNGPATQYWEFPEADNAQFFNISLAGLVGNRLKLQLDIDDLSHTVNHNWSGVEELTDYCAAFVQYNEGTQDDITGPGDPNQGEY